MKYQLILQSQKDFFHSGATLPVPYRLEVLSLLEGAIQNRQEQIESALAEDLGKSQQEAYSTEIAIVLSELSHAKRHLKSWARSKKAPVPLSHWPGRQQVTPVPYGSVLILAPWNYPFQLCLSPLISAPVSYTHLDVYKRQPLWTKLCVSNRRGGRNGRKRKPNCAALKMI